MSKVIEIKGEQELNDQLKSSQFSILFFWADWHAPCKQMKEVFKELANDHPALRFMQVEAEALASITEKYPVKAVPTFIALKGNRVLESLQGANASKLVAFADKFSKQASVSVGEVSSKVSAEEELNERLRKLVRAAPVMAFIKGTPDQPKCGFTRQLVELLKSINAQYGYFDILTDQSVREGLKKLSNWPTYPQLYINGELVGGLDVCKEMAANGELQGMLPKTESGGDSLNNRLKELINKQKVMLFMKGSPSAPRCGFSKQLVETLNEAGFDYGYFDILLDQTVREGLKKYSNWPTYPQLYVNGELVGGLDVVNEMKQNGELAELVAKSKSK